MRTTRCGGNSMTDNKKNLKKKHIKAAAVLSISIMLTTVLAACGGSSPKTEGSASPEQTAVSEAGAGTATAAPTASPAVPDKSAASSNSAATASANSANSVAASAETNSNNPAASSVTPAPAEATAAPVPSSSEGVFPADLTFTESEIAQMPDDMAALTTGIGPQYNEFIGVWYSVGNNMCLWNSWHTIDGQTYHFNEQGLMDRGWKLIDGVSCYFNDDGVYCPGEDNSKLVAFTFDDGPSQGMDMIIDLCSQTGARVTFFMIGKQVEEGGAVIQFMRKYRCEPANHSYTHTQMTTMTPEQCGEDFATGNAVIAMFNRGIPATLCRFPYGDVTEAHTAAAAMPCILWDVDSLDWELQDRDQIIQRVMAQIQDGSVILMHDRHMPTVEACQYLFPELQSQGYRLVTVSELAAAKGVQLQPGGVYTNF